MNWKNKRVFVSGGSGVIGSALVNNLLQAGASVFVGDLKPKPKSWNDLRIYREGDLIDLTKEEVSSFSPEVFFHLAATFERSIETEDFWHENFHHNVCLSHHLLSLLKDLPDLKTIIFASSYLIYSPTLYLFPSPQQQSIALKEQESVAPRNLCGMAKLLHEQELAFVKKFRPDLQIINTRIFRSYGKNSRDIISRWIQSLLKKEPLIVYCPEGRFDFVFAEDVAKSLQLLAETFFSGTVNLGSGRSRSILEVLQILREHFPDLSYEENVLDIPYESSQADLSLFNQLVPHFAFNSLEATIPELVEFYKEGREG